MKFTIQRGALLDGLQKVQSVVEKRNTIQILGNILCTTKGNELSLSATDLEVGIKISIPIDSQQDGKITLSAKHFLDIVRELPDKPLQISRKDNDWVEIVCGKTRFKIVSLSADEYPSLPTFEEKNYFEAKTEALNDMIDRTHFAVSTDATRYHLNGVYFEPLENNIIRMTATDGHRLSLVDHEVFLKSPELKRGIIIPKKGLLELRKLLSDGSPQVGLCFERGYVFAKFATSYLFIRLIDGEYPEYRPVIPKAADRLVKLEREAFNSALKRVSLVANEKSRGVKLALDRGSLEIGFNSKYLLDCLHVMDSDRLEFHLKDRLSPGILKSEGKENHTYVIMPMRI
jgi:DNA polymerase-3 subunit beta